MSKEHTTEHLCAELKSLSDMPGEVLSSSGKESKEESNKICSKAEQTLKQGRYRPGETSDVIAKRTRVAATRADRYVRKNPWIGMGIGVTIGVVLGVLLSRRQLWRTLITREDPVKAFWVSGNKLFPLWLKW